MKYLILVIALIIGRENVAAQIGKQVPQFASYYHEDEIGGYGNGYGMGSLPSFKPLDTTYVLMNIYPKNSFNAPSGKITHVYFVGNLGNVPLGSYGDSIYNFRLKMGHTSLSNFDSLMNGKAKDPYFLDSTLKAMKEVLAFPSMLIRDTDNLYPSPIDNAGMWVRMKLDQPFNYYSGQNLLIAMGHVSEVNERYSFGFRKTYDSLKNGNLQPFLPHQYMIVFDADSIANGSKNAIKMRTSYDFGFDLTPSSSVNTPYSDYAYRVYPNPANAQLTIESVKKLGAYKILDITGAIVSSGTATNNVVQGIDKLINGTYILQFMQENTLYLVRFLKE